MGPAIRSLLIALVVLLPATASAKGVFWKTEDLLSDFFRGSEKVSFVELDVKANRDTLRHLLGYVPKRNKYVVFVAKSGKRIDGYAVIDEELGQHEPITFGVKITPAGHVERFEVMVYREGYGDEIRSDRFRRQFTDKSIETPIRFGQDVVAVSGATISSKAMAIGVRRSVALVSLLKQRTAHAAASVKLDPRKYAQRQVAAEQAAR